MRLKPYRLIKDCYITISLEKLRACPICPKCGSKKFDRVKTVGTVVRCVNCGKEISI